MSAKSKKPGTKQPIATRGQNLTQAAKIAAIDRAQAVIEFDLDGHVLDANENFLRALGYELPEIRGKHHSMFCDQVYASTPEYQAFWDKLRRGEYDAGAYRRIGKGGRDVWIQASYNPILDAKGVPRSVVKFATDITQQKNQQAEFEGKLAAIDKSQAVIEFALDGTVLTANENFLKTLGYSLDEVRGQHHRMFCEAAYVASAAYKSFWEKLRRGEFDTGVYRRVGKNNKEIWIQASYNPILDANNRVTKVVKFATDVTEQKNRSAESEGKLAAIDKAQATIEFALDGTVLTANENFLKTLGYSLDEIRGRHHRMFCEPGYAASAEYQAFWEKLRRGEFDTGVYRRLGKDNKEVWIQASYNPILDANNRVYKVVKFATDVTAQRRAQDELAQLMTEVQGVMGGVASGDLTRTMVGRYKEGLEETKVSINQAVLKLRELATQITESTSAVSGGASDIAEGNSNLNRRTQEQASALEETASSIEEMTATVKQNAANAVSANQLATGARESAEKGGQVVGAAVLAMSAITDSAKKVADIISVIEQIAFQTNMLALNAAVEAARAGDQGRGFAVVAAEVRNLAQRSAGAAKEIKGLIQDSNEKVQQGAKLVNQSGETLQEIVGSVKKVTDIIGEIAAASEEQSSGIDQINSAVAAMDKTTQENAALVEEAASAAESLMDQARTMTSVIEFFKIDDAPRAAKAQPRPPVSGTAGAASPGRPAPQAPAARAKAAPAKGATVANAAHPSNGRPVGAKAKAINGQADSDWKDF